jgi:hypothetical protein
MGAYKGIYSSVETAHCLDVNRLVGRIKEAVKTSYSQKSGEGELTARDVSDAVEHNLKMFSLENQTFEFFSIANVKVTSLSFTSLRAVTNICAKTARTSGHHLPCMGPQGATRKLSVL